MVCPAFRRSPVIAETWPSCSQSVAEPLWEGTSGWRAEAGHRKRSMTASPTLSPTSALGRRLPFFLSPRCALIRPEPPREGTSIYEAATPRARGWSLLVMKVPTSPKLPGGLGVSLRPARNWAGNCTDLRASMHACAFGCACVRADAFRCACVRACARRCAKRHPGRAL